MKTGYLKAGVFILIAAAGAMAGGLDTGIVRDNNNAAVSGVTVTYTRGTNSWTVTTDANGIYRLKLGTQATFDTIDASTTAGSLVASKIGYVNSSALAMTVAAADTLTGAKKGNADLRLTIRITTGTVVDSFNSVPIAGAKVLLKRAGAFIDSTVTDGSGNFILSRIASADSIIVTAPGYFRKFFAISSGSGNLGLVAFGAIAGKITADSLHGPTIAGASVTIARTGSTTAPAQTATTIQGQYRVDSLTAYLGYTVTASAPGRISASLTISPKTKGLDSANFALLPATALITGTITADSTTGMKLKSAKVVLAKNMSGTFYSPVDSTITDSVGHYVFVNDSVGKSYQITATSNGYNPDTASLIKTINTDVVNFIMIPGKTKTFYVKVVGNPGFAPHANVSVGLTNAGSVIGAVTNSSGVAMLANAPTGFDTLSFADSLGTSKQQIFIVNAHSPDTLVDTLVMPLMTGRSVRGIVRVGIPTTGPAAPGTLIVFKTAGNWVFAAVSNTAGNYSVVGIPTTITSIPIYAALSGMGLIATPAVGLTVAGWANIQSYTNAAGINIAAAGSTILNITLPTGCACGTLVLITNSFTPNATSALNWTAVTGAASYSVQVSAVSTFATTIASQTGVTGTSTSVAFGALTRYYWRVQAVNGSGASPWSAVGTLISTSVSVIPANEMKAGFSVRSSAIAYSLAKSSPVEIAFYDIMGRTAFAMNRMQAAGNYYLSFKTCRLASGHYLVRFKAGGIERRVRVMVTR